MKSIHLRIILFAVVALGVLLFYRYHQPRYIAGEVAPGFQVTLDSGETVRLSDLKGRYVLLQFWGSWCGPCRTENAQLVELYRAFHARGFEILSIALQKNAHTWRQAIEQDGLVWKYHAMENDEFSGPVTRLYNIHTIPSTTLINPEGVVMGVNLEPAEIRRMLESALGSR